MLFTDFFNSMIRATLCVLIIVATGQAQANPKSISPHTAIDRNPAPDVVEITLVAHERAVDYGIGNKTMVYSYNGGIPGPTIEGKVGDTLIVHFYNALPEATTIHWHGLELPANMDGSNIAQNPVESGEYFRYEFKLSKASLFWYHPHIRTNTQVEKGLYGALIVHDPAQNAELGLPENENILVLDDVLVNLDGQLTDTEVTDPLENAERLVNGREGNILLVNGKPDRWANMKPGVPNRLRVVNVSNARFMRISLSDHDMYRIGGDGGLLESPILIEPIAMVDDGEGNLISDPDPGKGLILTPGERADLVFTPRGSEPIKLEWHDTARGRHSAFYKPDGSIGLGDAEDDGKRPPQTLMTFKLRGRDRGAADYVPPAALRDIEPINAMGGKMLMSMFGHSAPNAEGDITFFVQAMMKDGMMMPLPFPKVTPELAHTVTVGDKGMWMVVNMTGGMHNFHTHGFGFQLISIEYQDDLIPENNYVVPAEYLEDKDTILLPARPGGRGTSRTIARLAAHFTDEGREGQVEAFGKEPTDTTSGGWLFHCHLLEHSANGMMSFFQVMNPEE
jgi:FtsP/CotA-like multicopper oxidase with cupredoxin domain